MIDKYSEAEMKIPMVLYVDGSFVTDKPSPRDVDVIAHVEVANMGRAIAHRDRLALLDRPANQTRYEVDLVFEKSDILGTVLLFQSLRTEEAIVRKVDPGTKKGILKLVIT